MPKAVAQEFDGIPQPAHPQPDQAPIEFLEFAREHIAEAILEHGASAIDIASQAVNLLSSGEEEVMDAATMETRIAEREATITAAGTGNWKWQLRDRNGQWIDMGALVKWMADKSNPTNGGITGSPQEGMAEVEESKTKRRLRIASNRLTCWRARRRRGGFTGQNRDDKGTLDVGAIVNRKKGGSSQPERRTPCPRPRHR